MELPERVVDGESQQRQIDDQGRESVHVKRVVAHATRVLEVRVSPFPWICPCQVRDKTAIVINQRESVLSYQAVVSRQVAVCHPAILKIRDGLQPYSGKPLKLTRFPKMLLNPQMKRLPLGPAHLNDWTQLSCHPYLAISVREVNHIRWYGTSQVRMKRLITRSLLSCFTREATKRNVLGAHVSAEHDR